MARYRIYIIMLLMLFSWSSYANSIQDVSYICQGSVRAVVNQSGKVVQATDYSAYGVPSTRYKMTADNRLHLELEWQPMKGLYGYYNNARFRDPLLAGTIYLYVS